MDLFNSAYPENILPADGEVKYYGPVMPLSEASHYFGILMETVAWKNDEAVIYGKHIVTKRKVAWYGDAAYLYTYSNTTRQALPWTNELLTLKQKAEELTGAKFNACLLNLYHDGSEGMSWHSDDEKQLEKHGAIASFSFGATRKFSFRHKHTKQTVDIVLEPGSLLCMKGVTQDYWLHSLPKSARVSGARINLTFRNMVAQP